MLSHYVFGCLSTFFLEFIRHCLHIDHSLFKYQIILDGLRMVKIHTEYHVNVPKVFGVHMFYVSQSIVNGIQEVTSNQRCLIYEDKLQFVINLRQGI